MTSSINQAGNWHAPRLRWPGPFGLERGSQRAREYQCKPWTLAGGPPVGKSPADVRGSLNKNVQMEILCGQAGECVWCIQFMELAVVFTRKPRGNDSQG
ncbi:hypothetical protein F5B17DRAFT_411201 [Nemania serpens]|nr:hypothetical protein F5B17DRAFT_411201 [Nemania serpens]